MSDICQCVIDEGVATITMRSGKVNAFDHNLINTLRDQFTELADKEEVKAVILAGKEGIFSAGFDLNMRAGEKEAEELVANGHDLLRQLLYFLNLL